MRETQLERLKLAAMATGQIVVEADDVRALIHEYEDDEALLVDYEQSNHEELERAEDAVRQGIAEVLQRIVENTDPAFGVDLVMKLEELIEDLKGEGPR